MMADVCGGEITSQVANDQGGVGQFPYLTQVCALILSIFFSHCSLLSLAIDHPFLYCS